MMILQKVFRKFWDISTKTPSKESYIFKIDHKFFLGSDFYDSILQNIFSEHLLWTVGTVKSLL